MFPSTYASTRARARAYVRTLTIDVRLRDGVLCIVRDDARACVCVCGTLLVDIGGCHEDYRRAILSESNEGCHPVTVLILLIQLGDNLQCSNAIGTINGDRLTVLSRLDRQNVARGTRGSRE